MAFLIRSLRGKRWRLPFGAGAVALALTLSPALRAEAYRQPPNSRVAMEVSGTFTASGRFTGFLDEKSGASFVIVEMPGAAFDEVRKLADQPDALAAQGIIDTRKRDLPGREGEYVYVTGIQRTPLGDYAKFLLIMRDSGVTAMITANVPVAALRDKIIAAEQIEGALRTAAVRPSVAKTAALFQLGYLGPFREAVSLMGTSKAYSLTGKPPEPGAVRLSEPLFVVSPSLEQMELPDVKAATLKAFRTLGGFKGHTVARENEVVIAGLRGYVVSGEAEEIRSGKKAAIYLVMLAGRKGGYFLMVGTAPAAESAVYLAEFQKMTASFKPLE